jgi:hypothetical protein
MKKWWTSKTLWANVISIGIALADQLLGYKFLTAEMHLYIIGTLNLVFRFLTKEPIA